MGNDLVAVNGSHPRWRVHFTLTPKGGVGKSFVSICQAQREMARGRPITCFDADAATPTLCEFPALGAIRIDMMPNGVSTIDASQFDTFAEAALTAPSRCAAQARASRYVALTHTILANDVFEQIHARPRKRWCIRSWLAMAPRCTPPSTRSTTWP
jgi:hypothetical protein